MKSRILPLSIFGWFFLFSSSLFSQTSFTEANLPPGGIISSLIFRDSLQGYATGENGRVLKSSNGGLSWTAISPATTEWIRGLAWLGNDTLLAIAEDGLLHTSVDAGASWTAKTISAAPLTHIRVRNHKVMATAADGAVMVNPHRSLYLSFQLGGDWANLDQFIWLNDSLGFIMADSTHAFAGKSVLFRTRDGGKSWSRVSKIQSYESFPGNTIFRDYSWKNLHHITQTNDSTLILAGGYYPAFIWKSTDTGQSFTLVQDMVQCNPLQVEALDSNRSVLFSWEGDALYPYLVTRTDPTWPWPQYLTDSGITPLPMGFYPWGKAVFTGKNRALLPGFRRLPDGSSQGAVVMINLGISSGTTSNTPISGKNTLSAYPNPGYDWVEVKGAVGTVQILDAMGKAVQAEQIQDVGGVHVKTGTLPAGVYYLRIGNQGTTWIRVP